MSVGASMIQIALVSRDCELDNEPTRSKGMTRGDNSNTKGLEMERSQRKSSSRVGIALGPPRSS